MIFHRMVLGGMTTNCYVVADEETKNAILFDAPANPERILEYLSKKELKLCYVCLTHAHFDHMMALDNILKETGAKLLLHKEEEKYLNNPELNLISLTEEKLPEFSEYSLLNDDEIIILDSLNIKVIHTPGHTEGSVCYHIGETLISGDTLFNRSIGRADFPLGSFDDEISSIVNKLMILNDDVKVYPGHGFSTTIGRERKENPYLI